jgi:6-phospho-beta-glucosidase
MKATILGGGGFRTPYIYRELATRPGGEAVEELVLFDNDPVRLDAVRAVLHQMEPAAHAPRIVTTTSAEEAVADAGAVFAAIRVGGLEGRLRDEHAAQALGLLGQETTGAGGIAYALRTVPVMVRYAELIARRAPDAYLINFTNPAGIITEATQRVLGDRAIGVCDTPSSLVRRVCGLLDVPAGRAELDYVGLNHLGWLRGVTVDGVDRLPELLADDERLAELEEAAVFGMDWLRALGAIPNEYLYYYYCNREAVRALMRSPETRGDRLAASQEAMFAQIARHPETAFQTWMSTVRERNASYMSEARGTVERKSAEHASETDADLFADSYAGVAVAVMTGLRSGAGQQLVLNVRNGDTVPGLPADAVVEVPTTVSVNGVAPAGIRPPTDHQLGLMLQVKTVERLTNDAALTGDRAAALQAFALHPLVNSIAAARTLVDAHVPRPTHPTQP